MFYVTLDWVTLLRNNVDIWVKQVNKGHLVIWVKICVRLDKENVSI